MTAKKGDFAAALAGELTQSLLIVSSGHVIHAHHPLVKAQSRRAVSRLLPHFAAVKPGIAAVQQPAIGLLNRDTRVTRRMARQRN